MRRLAGRAAAAALLGVALGGCAAKVPAPRAPAAAAPGSAAIAAEPPLPAVVLRPADEARARTLLVGRQAPATRIEAALAPLAARLGAPWDVPSWLLAQVGNATAQAALPAAALERADRRRAATVIGLVPGLGFGITACAAIPFPDDASARAAAAAVGHESARTGGVSRRTLADGATVWVAWGPGVLFVSGQEGAIEAGGALALEEMARGTADAAAPALWVEFRPQAFGPALPALLKMGMTAALSKPAAPAGGKGRAAAPEPPEKAAAGREMAMAMVDGLSQIAVVRATVQIDQTVGLAVHLVVVPVAGSTLAGELAGAVPYAIDARLPASEASTAVTAFGGKGPVVDGMAWIAAHGGASGHGFGVALDGLSNQMGGGVSCTLRLQSPMDMGCVWSLRKGAKPNKVLDLYVAFLRTASAWNAAMGRGTEAAVRVQRRAGVLEVEEQVPEDHHLTKEARRQLLGGDTRKTAATVRDDQLITAQGVRPRELLATLLAATPAAPAPLLVAALQRTAGAHAVFFLDLPSAVMKMSAGSADPGLRQVNRMMSAVPGLAQLRAPVILSLRSHEALDLEIALPTESIQNIGEVLRPFMGVMGGAPRH